MLLRFRVTNYASLRDEQELNLTALDDHDELATRPLPLSRDQVLPAVGIFGPNASGKSNVIKALHFARSVITESHQFWLPEEPIPRWPFKLDDVNRGTPSQFIFDFVHEGDRFEYGFAIDNRIVHHEWLFSWPRGKRQRLFERIGSKLEFGPNLIGHKAAIADVVRENSLFLSAAAANNHVQLRPIAAWFGRSRWTAITSGRVYLNPRADVDDETLGLLKFADFGIVGATMVERTAAEVDLSYGRSRRLHRASRPESMPDEAGPDNAPPRSELRTELIHVAETAVGRESLPWHWESSGTQTWFFMAECAVRALRTGGILTIDDLGSDLHPLLTSQLLGLFQSKSSNHLGAQLIFTGHDVSLFGKKVEHRLKRDQIWLTEKARTGATKLYPLTEYGRVRDGLDDIEGRYLQGRYGATPFFDEDHLRPIQAGRDA